MMMQKGVVLGHISHKGIQVDPAKIEVITNLPILAKKKDVRCFLGHPGYYRHFIKYFKKMATPLYNLLTKDVEFQWIEDCDRAFSNLKAISTHAPILKGPNWELPFHIHIDASKYAIGVVLGQKEGEI